MAPVGCTVLAYAGGSWPTGTDTVVSGWRDTWIASPPVCIRGRPVLFTQTTVGERWADVTSGAQSSIAVCLNTAVSW